MSSDDELYYDAHSELIAYDGPGLQDLPTSILKIIVSYLWEPTLVVSCEWGNEFYESRATRSEYKKQIYLICSVSKLLFRKLGHLVWSGVVLSEGQSLWGRPDNGA